MNRHRFSVTILFLLTATVSAVQAAAKNADTAAPLSLIVMDPLAAPLSCPCVEGYAQRNYKVLAEHLSAALGRKVKVTFGQTLKAALRKSEGRADLVIGKDSVVRADSGTSKIAVLPIGQLTDMQGSTQQYGLIVVNRDDPAKSVADLGGYTIIFGPSEADEKHSAAQKLLTDAGIQIPRKLTIDLACSDGACKVIDLGPKSKTAAVISSYAQPLLEGCGTIRKGDLRVVGKTAPVAFVTAFAAKNLPVAERNRIRTALLDVATKPKVLEAMESLVGFLPVADTTTSVAPTVAKKK